MDSRLRGKDIRGSILLSYNNNLLSFLGASLSYYGMKLSCYQQDLIYQARQNSGTNKTKIVNISSRPANIVKDRIHFAGSFNEEKLVET